QFGGWSDLLAPLIQMSPGFADAAGPDPVHQNPGAVAGCRRVVDPAHLDMSLSRHCASASLTSPPAWPHTVGARQTARGEPASPGARTSAGLFRRVNCRACLAATPGALRTPPRDETWPDP